MYMRYYQNLNTIMLKSKKKREGESRLRKDVEDVYRYQELIEAHGYAAFLHQLPASQQRQDEETPEGSMGKCV